MAFLKCFRPTPHPAPRKPGSSMGQPEGEVMPTPQVPAHRGGPQRRCCTPLAHWVLSRRHGPGRSRHGGRAALR